MASFEGVYNPIEVTSQKKRKKSNFLYVSWIPVLVFEI